MLQCVALHFDRRDHANVEGFLDVHAGVADDFEAVCGEELHLKLVEVGVVGRRHRDTPRADGVERGGDGPGGGDGWDITASA